MYQEGFPDLYCCHFSLGTRWVEVKMPIGYVFTPAQIKTFPEFNAKGVGVWIMTAATEFEYKKLFQPQNWYTYLGVCK